MFSYQLMLLSLKEVGATYERAITVLSKEMLGHTVECYVDDLVVKSREDRPLRTSSIPAKDEIFEMCIRGYL